VPAALERRLNDSAGDRIGVDDEDRHLARFLGEVDRGYV
jgi:hypothetical protein